ncbi:YbaB/EbfC family DNA-binding protein [Mycolicibacterium sp. 22603]|uniref:YbaB/EbfC family DNA-binding protein n=1 Tax=Mycolicibacterium sp. 22603 TaxID=3453950 RepID=UPI003F853CB8
MTTGTDPWDDDDDEVVLGDDRSSDLAAFDVIGSTDTVEADESEDPAVSFTVANPSGTVVVTALLGGRIQRIELAPEIVQMTESELCAEITTVADLAADKALAAQHGVVLTLMRDLGHDDGLVRDFLERNLGLPSPEKYLERASTAFADRYRDL